MPNDRFIRDTGEHGSEERIRNNEDFIKESYQPTEDSLDNDNPPGGGSGVPTGDE